MKRRYTFFSALVWLALFCSTVFAVAQESRPTAAKSVSYNTGTYFIKNKGQWDDSVRYLTRRNGMDMWVLPSAFVYDVYKLRAVAGAQSSLDPMPVTGFEREGHVFRMNFLGASTSSDRGTDRRAEYHNYFIGNDSAKWASHVPLYNTIELEHLYPGISAVVYDDNGSPRYDLVIQPDADPAMIAMNIDGAKSWRIDESGNLLIETSVGTMTHGKLFAYQTSGDIKQPVECHFVTNGIGKEKTLTFALGAYDHTRPLVIDPLIYSTYIGGNNPSSTHDVATGVQVDAAGYAYVTGYTNASGFPTMSGAYRTYPAGGGTGFNAFVAKVYPNGDDLEYLTVLGGGSGDDIARDIAIDFSNNPYITGYTSSSTFPTLNAYDASYNGGAWDVFVTKLNNDGTLTGTAYSTYLGGDDVDKAYAIDVQAGNAYITGYSNSTTASYPVTTGAFDIQGDGAGDVILTKLSSTGALVYSTFIGGVPNVVTQGGAFDCGLDIVVAANGEPYITGITGGGFFPVMPGAYDVSFNICGRCPALFNLDVFIIHFASDCVTRLGSTFFGGNRPDYGSGITVDNSGNIYIIGTTMSDAVLDGFPVTLGAYQTTSNIASTGFTVGDAFIAKFNGLLTNLQYSTYLSGAGTDLKDYGCKIALEQSSGNTYVYAVGATESGNFPIKPDPGAYITTNRGLYDVFIAKLQFNSNGEDDLVYSTYFGGQADDGFTVAAFGDDYPAISSLGLAHTVTSDGIITFAGPTASNRSGSDPFPISSDAWDDSFTSSIDGFVSRFQVGIDYIKILSPTTASRTAFCQGETVNISWTHSLGISRVIVELLNSGGSVQQQLSDQATPPQFYSWQVPANFPAGDYTIRIRDYANNDLETSATITIRALPSITDQPDNVEICNGNLTPIVLSVTATGTNITYQWYQVPGVPLSGQTSATLNLGVATPALNGTQYYVKVSNICAEVTSSTVTIRVIEPPTVTGPSVTAIELCEGNSTTLTVTVTGTSVAIVWEYQPIGLSTWTTITGETSATLQLNNVDRSWNGRKYRARVTDPVYNCGNGVSGTVTLTVNWTPQILANPSPFLNPICEGETFSLRGLVINASPQETIEWQISDASGNDVSSTVLASNVAANPSELDLVKVPLGWNGYRIFARASNPCGSATTATITLKVLAKPRIQNISPATLTICEDLEAKFEVQATGATLQYQWYKVGTGMLSGRTAKELIINPVTRVDAGEYYVEVSGDCAPKATTTHVFLVVQTKPKITTQPDDYELVCTGGTYRVTAVATGTNATYQWQKYDPTLGTFEDISGEISSTLTITNVQVSHAGRYRLIVSGSCAPADPSNDALLEVGIKPYVETNGQPAAVTVCEGSDAKFFVVVGSDVYPAADISWEVFPKNGSAWLPLSATGSPLTLSSVTDDMDGNLYRAVFTNDCGSIETNAALLTVNTAPVVGKDPKEQIVCAGDDATFSVDVKDGVKPNPDITWEVSTDDGATWTTMASITPNATTATLTLNAVSAGMDGNLYRAVLTNLCDVVRSQAALLTVNTAPVVGKDPTEQIVCAGDDATFSVDVKDGVKPNPDITWEVSTDDGVTWTTMASITPNATTATLTLNAVSAGMDGNLYRAVLTNLCDVARSQAALLTVNTAPVVGKDPTEQIVCAGDDATFSVDVKDGVKPNPDITWEVSTDDGVTWTTMASITPNATTATLTLNAVSAGMDGNLYRAVLTNRCDIVRSQAALLTVNTAPVVGKDPTEQIVCAGDDATFSVDVKDGVKPNSDITWEVSTDDGVTWTTMASITPNATTATLTLNAVSAGMDGNLYRAVLTNRCDIVRSQAALLTVNTAPVVGKDPTEQIVCAGDDATFSVDVKDGVKPNSDITWEVSTDDGVTWTTMASITPNATTATLTLNAVSAGMDGNLYRAVLTNLCDVVRSQAALLTVNTAPVVGKDPTEQIVCAGDDATFSVDVKDGVKPNPDITWEVSTDDGATWTTMASITPNATTATLTLNAVSAGMDGNLYRAILTNLCDIVRSQAALLTVNTAPVVGKDPTEQIVCAGDDATFSVDVKDGVKPNPDITWEVSTDDGVTWTTMASITPNATTATLTLNAVSAGMDGNLYRAVFTNLCDIVRSQAALLTVNTAPVVGKDPTEQIVCAGDDATFSIDVKDGVKPNPDITWEVSTDDGATWTTMASITPNATTATLTLNAVSAGMDGNLYRAVLTNLCDVVRSQAALLTVNTAPVVGKDPKEQVVCAGDDATFSVDVKDGVKPNPDITWEVSTDDGATWTTMASITPNATTATLTLNAVSAGMDGNLYRAVLTNLCDVVRSQAAVLTVKTRPEIKTSPTSAIKCVGESVTFYVEATGSNLTYTWRRRNTMDTIARGPDVLNYTIDPVTISDADTYEVIVSGYCDVLITSATLVVNEPPAIIQPPMADTVCEGKDVEFKVIATGATLSYQWYRGSAILMNDTNSTLDLSNVTTGTAGIYRVEISGACSPPTSATVVLTVNTAPNITNQPTSRPACEGNSTVFSVAATGTDLQYQWRKDGVNISGANSSQLTVNDITQADAGQYDVVITGACEPPITSSRATLTVNTAPKITLEPLSQIVCEGETLQLTVEATGAGRTFQWRKDGVNIPAPEGISQTYIVPNVTAAANGVYDVIVSGTCPPPDTSNAATISVQLPPQISGVPVFPVVQCPGESSRDTIVITNPGEATLSMNAITISSPRFTVLDPVGPFDIPPMGSRNVIIEFRPLKAGIEAGSVNFTTVRCNTQILSSISARADSVRITSLPEVQFKSVAQCDGPDVQEILVENTGDVEVSVTPFFSDPRFALDNPADNPVVIPAGSNRRVKVRFTSGGTPDNNIIANVRFRANHCNYETITVLKAKSIRVAYEATVPGGTLDFGTLAGCQTNITRQFPIKNIGNAPVTITSATTTNPAFGVTLPQNPLVLQVGSTATVTVQFGSGPPGPVTGKLILRSGAPCPQDTTFDLVGNRGNVAISSDIQALTFPKLLSCGATTVDTVIVITNNGTEDASFGVSNILAPFSIEDIQPGATSFPRTVQAGTSIRVRLAYKPTAEGDHGQTINFPFTWGACADTLKIQVAGSFVTPVLKADITSVDFGALLGCDGTVDTTITLTNPGREDLSINDITDPTGYIVKALLPTSLPLSIPAGDSVKIRVRFAPPAPGTYNTTLTLKAEPCDVTVAITLRGSKQGVSFTDIPGDVVDFGYVVACSTDNIPPKSYTITNTSDGDVSGTVTYTLSGPFETTLQQNTALPNGTPIPFDISFRPTGKGEQTGELRLVYEPCGITRIITLKGIVTDVQLASNGTLSFPDETVGNTSAIKTVIFTNAGSTTLTIESISNLVAPFSVVSTTPPIPRVLDPGKTLRVDVTFTPTADGDFSSILRVESNTPCPIFSEVLIEGRGTNAPQPNITFTGLDFEGVYVNMSRTMKVTITNDGFDEGKVYSITSDNPQFVVQSLNYPIAVAKEGGSFDVDVTFTPTSPGPHQATLKVLSDGGSPEGALKGIGIPLPIGKTTLAMPALTAEAGTNGFAIPIRLAQQQKLDETQAITSLTFDVSFNATLFYPTGVSRGQIINNTFDPGTHVRTVTIKLEAADFSGIPVDGNILTDMIGDVLLGNSESTALTFSNIDWEVQLGDAEALTIDGSLTLTNVCRVGGARLIKLNKTFGITSMTPNPASDQVEIVVEVPGNGEASLEIYSLTGSRMYESHWTVTQNKESSTASTVNKTFVIHTSELPSGVYQVMLRSRERLDTQRLIIVK